MSSICKNKKTSRALMVLAIILLIALYWMRVINLDQDLPAWDVGMYQPKDEGCYAMLAISEWEYGTINPVSEADTGLTYPLYTQEHMRSNIIGNLLEIASFHTFGDNYYGLRMPMVLIGFLNLVALGCVLLELRKLYGKQTDAELWGIIGILLLMSHHFYFYLSSRTVEPSTLRMLFAQLTFLIWLKSQKKGAWCFFLMGACITTSVFLVYITNVFLYLAAALLLLMIWKTDGFERFARNLGAFAAGSLLLFAVAEAYYYFVWDTFAITNAFASVGTFLGVGGYEAVSGSAFIIIRDFLLRIIAFFSSNFFLYSPAFLVLVLVLYPVSAWSAIKEKDKNILFLIAAPTSFLLQTTASEDYIIRKFLVVCPYVIYLIYWGVLNSEKVALFFKNCGNGWGKAKNKKRTNGYRIAVPAYIILCALLAAFVAVYRMWIKGDRNMTDISATQKALVLTFGCLPAVVWAIGTVAGHAKGKNIAIVKATVFFGITTLILSLSLLFVNVWYHPTFEERDSMISLSEDHNLDGKYVTGDFVAGITLYNDLKPVFLRHTDYAARTIENPEMIIHFYHLDDKLDFQYYFDRIIYVNHRKYTADEIALVPGMLMIEGKVKDFALYQTAVREYENGRGTTGR